MRRSIRLGTAMRSAILGNRTRISNGGASSVPPRWFSRSALCERRRTSGAALETHGL